MKALLPVVVVLSTGAVSMAHPTLKHKIDPARLDQYQRDAAPALALSDEQWLSFVPDRPTSVYCECPVCFGGTGDREFTWSIEAPGRMTCRHCGAVFPDEQFPEDQTLSGKNARGETISFAYHRHPDKRTPHHLSDHLRHLQRRWLLRACDALAKLYHLTGEERYARSVVLVLDRMATAYPHFPVIRQLPRTFTFRESQEPPYEWDSGRWGYFHNEVPKELLIPYDLVYNSTVFAEISAERGYDIRARFENDFLRPAAEAAIPSPHHMSNIIGYDVMGVAMLGQVIAEPRYVHWAYGKMRDVVEKGFYYDGFWHESPSYHYMTVGGLRAAFDSVRDYSDPPGYADPATGTRFDNLDPDAELAFWRRLQNAPSILDLPTGWSTAVHDTHPYERRSAPRERTVSALAPGFGHASLGRGQDEHQMLAQLHFSGGVGHGHRDALNLTLWAKQSEMLPDLGYTWTQMRHWATSTLAHNTVVINRASQSVRHDEGNLLMFFGDNAGIAAVEADARDAYRDIDGIEQYRRLLVTVPVSDQDGYVVDIFRVRGGRMHDWSLHGDADQDTTATCSLPLSQHHDNLMTEGEIWNEPTLQYSTYPVYGVVRDVGSARTVGPFTITFNYGEETGKALRMHMDAGDAEVLLGRSPSVRRMGVGGAGDMRKAWDFWMPHLIVRREAEADNGMGSIFTAIHEPYVGAARIDHVARVALVPADEHAVALRVRHGNIVDTILSSIDDVERTTEDGIKLRGKLAVVRQVDGHISSMWLLDGASLAAGEITLAGPAELHGTIITAPRLVSGEGRDAFVVDAPLPDGDALAGKWMIVTHGNGLSHAYEIARVESHLHGSLVVLSYDHGLIIDGDTTREAYFPQRTFTGKNRFRIPLDAVWQR